MKVPRVVLIGLLCGTIGWAIGNWQSGTKWEPPWTPSDDKVIARFGKLFYDRTDIWDNLTWLGVHAQQNPNDDAKVFTIDIEDKLAEARKVPLFNEKVASG